MRSCIATGINIGIEFNTCTNVRFTCFIGIHIRVCKHFSLDHLFSTANPFLSSGIRTFRNRSWYEWQLNHAIRFLTSASFSQLMQQLRAQFYAVHAVCFLHRSFVSGVSSQKTSRICRLFFVMYNVAPLIKPIPSNDLHFLHFVFVLRYSIRIVTLPLFYSCVMTTREVYFRI